MGYETTVYIVEKVSSMRPQKVCLLENGNIYGVYSDKKLSNRQEEYYYPDGNTQTFIADNPKVKEINPNLMRCSTIAIIEACKMGGFGFGSICKFKDGEVCAFGYCN